MFASAVPLTCCTVLSATGASKASRKRRKALQQRRAAWRRVSPMPVGSECQTSGLRSWVSSGKSMVVKIVVVSVGAELDGEEEDGEGFRADERRTR